MRGAAGCDREQPRQDYRSAHENSTSPGDSANWRPAQASQSGEQSSWTSSPKKRLALVAGLGTNDGWSQRAGRLNSTTCQRLDEAFA